MPTADREDVTERAVQGSEAGECRNSAAFLDAFQEAVAGRFSRLTAFEVVVSPMDLTGGASAVDSPAFPRHSLCRDSASASRCEAGWNSLLAELALRPEVHRHECTHGLLCASIPLVWHRRCLAVCRLVCKASVGGEAFEHGVELLDVLCENFVGRYVETWANLGAAVGPEEKPQGKAGSGAADRKRPLLHAKVRKAVEYIDEHFTDPSITMDGVARLLDVNPTYLAHLFTEQIGLRMSRYIADRRIGLAKRLLVGTTWQVKRVAKETGYANPDWFSHVFHAQTGMKPCEYRRRINSGRLAATN